MGGGSQTAGTQLRPIEPERISQNPNNPRRYFNEERLDLLRTSIQEVGILVPLIVYQERPRRNRYVLMDGERRWTCALDLGLDTVPASVIDPPDPLQNLLRMFNIHNVREDWPLISIALSLKDVIALSGEERESRVAEMTGLTRATVRRAKRLLSLPKRELDLIQEEAHLDRTQQIHREDLYLEIEAATSVLRRQLPEIAEAYTRARLIRQFARKRETGSLRAVTDFRAIGRLVRAVDEELVPRRTVIASIKALIGDPSLSPAEVFETVAARAYEQQAVQRKAELLQQSLTQLDRDQSLSTSLLGALRDLRNLLNLLLKRKRQ